MTSAAVATLPTSAYISSDDVTRKRSEPKQTAPAVRTAVFDVVQFFQRFEWETLHEIKILPWVRISHYGNVVECGTESMTKSAPTAATQPVGGLVDQALRGRHESVSVPQTNDSSLGSP
ncbi:hypothetical protein J6590_080889 [Homalodisca vitripennis]|nr:hypothetical protein J6590_080889 [Homalodisca vitripennis]